MLTEALFDQQQQKKHSNIKKYSYSLKYLFSILIYSKINLLYFWQSCFFCIFLPAITYSLQWHMIFQKLF